MNLEIEPGKCGYPPRRYSMVSGLVMVEIILIGVVRICGKQMGIYEIGCDNNLNECCKFACKVFQREGEFYLEFNKKIIIVDKDASPASLIQSLR